MKWVKARRCKKCGEMYKNLCVLQCKCGEELPMMPEIIEFDEGNLSEDVVWYKKCGVCDTEYRLNSKDQIIFQCEQCGNTDISNQDPYAKSSETPSIETLAKEEKQIGCMKKSNSLGQKTATTKEEEIKAIEYVELKNIDDGKLIRIRQGSYVIGKLGEIEQDYFYKKPYIGREHTMIYVEKDNVTVMDNDSKNWTRINGSRILKQDGKKEIKSGDRLTLADQTFEVSVCW